MKKIFAIILSLMLVITMVSCSKKTKGEGNTSTSEAQAEPSSQEVEPSGEESELSEYVTESSEDESSEEVKPAFSYTKYQDYEEIKYVALGDSIARGYGLEDPIGRSYPALVARAMDKALANTAVSFTNYGVDGLTTGGLIDLMASGCEAIDGADIITVCIGANNMLGAFLGVVEKHYADFIPAEERVDKSGDSAQNAALIDGIKAIEAELESPEFEAKLQEGIDLLKEHYPKIIDELRRRAPEAEIIFMTVYSPYHGIDLSLPYLGISLDMGAISDKWVSAMNDAIREITAQHGCKLVESYGVFEAKGGLVNATLSLLPMSFDFDPHPNLFGHAELANLHLAVIDALE